MKQYKTEIELDNVLLPKWPQMRVWGVPVSADQAKEIILRTDKFLTSMHRYAGGNNHQWNAWAHAELGLTELLAEKSAYDWQERSAVTSALAEQLGHITTEYVSNSWASSSFIGGPHGWCQPDGTLFYNDNVGKWPSPSELLEDWATLATSFPYLDLTATFMSGESCEEDDEGTHPVFSIRVKDGVACAIVAVASPEETAKSEPVHKVFMRNWGAQRREQGLPDLWIKELGVRSRAALADILERTKAKKHAEEVS